MPFGYNVRDSIVSPVENKHCTVSEVLVIKVTALLFLVIAGLPLGSKIKSVASWSETNVSEAL